MRRMPTGIAIPPSSRAALNEEALIQINERSACPWILFQSKKGIPMSEHVTLVIGLIMAAFVCFGVTLAGVTLYSAGGREAS